MVEPLESYPHKLEQSLRGRYPAQEITVTNKGVGGEDPRGGVMRLPGVLDAERPDVLLLQEGTNGLMTARVIVTYATHLRTMVSLARQRQIDVIIANVLPVGPPHSDSRTRPTKPADIIQLNQRIEAIAAEFGIGPPLDLYAAFQANPSLLDFDGLHPTRAGYTRMAELFAEEIVSTLRRTEPDARCAPLIRRTDRFDFEVFVYIKRDDDPGSASVHTPSAYCGCALRIEEEWSAAQIRPACTAGTVLNPSMWTVVPGGPVTVTVAGLSVFRVLDGEIPQSARSLPEKAQLRFRITAVSTHQRATLFLRDTNDAPRETPVRVDG